MNVKVIRIAQWFRVWTRPSGLSLFCRFGQRLLLPSRKLLLVSDRSGQWKTLNSSVNRRKVWTQFASKGWLCPIKRSVALGGGVDHALLLSLEGQQAFVAFKMDLSLILVKIGVMMRSCGSRKSGKLRSKAASRRRPAENDEDPPLICPP